MKLLPELFHSRARACVLQLLFGRNERTMYLSEISNVTGMSSRSIEVELKALVTLGLLTASRDRSRVYYSAARSNPAYPALKSLVASSAGLLGLLQESLALPAVVFAFIPSADPFILTDSSREVPLIVLTVVAPRGLDDIITDASTVTGRRFVTTILPFEQMRQGLATRQPAALSLLAANRIFVVGSDRRLHERLFVPNSTLPALLGPSSS